MCPIWVGDKVSNFSGFSHGSSFYSLLVRDLMDHSIPCETGVVDDDVDLSTSELGRLLYESVDVFVIEHVACDGDGSTSRGIDFFCDFLGFCCMNKFSRFAQQRIIR